MDNRKELEVIRKRIANMTRLYDIAMTDLANNRTYAVEIGIIQIMDECDKLVSRMENAGHQ